MPGEGQTKRERETETETERRQGLVERQQLSGTSVTSFAELVAWRGSSVYSPTARVLDRDARKEAPRRAFVPRRWLPLDAVLAR